MTSLKGEINELPSYTSAPMAPEMVERRRVLDLFDCPTCEGAGYRHAKSRFKSGSSYVQTEALGKILCKSCDGTGNRLVILERDQFHAKVEELNSESLEHCLDNPSGSHSRGWERADAVRTFINDVLKSDEVLISEGSEK